jgi:hypothetical protein
MKLLLLFLGWCILVLLCWVAALAAALLCSAGVWLARGWGVCRRVLRGRSGGNGGFPLR